MFCVSERQWRRQRAEWEAFYVAFSDNRATHRSPTATCGALKCLSAYFFSHFWSDTVVIPSALHRKKKHPCDGVQWKCLSQFGEMWQKFLFIRRKMGHINVAGLHNGRPRVIGAAWIQSVFRGMSLTCWVVDSQTFITDSQQPLIFAQFYLNETKNMFEVLVDVKWRMWSKGAFLKNSVSMSHTGYCTVKMWTVQVSSL